MNSVITVKDFTQIWDAYAKFEDSLLAGELEMAKQEGAEETEEDLLEVDLRMARYEHLIDRQPLLVNSVLLRQNPHAVAEWQKRAQLVKDSPSLVVETYSSALRTIDPLKALGPLNKLWSEFAHFYESNGKVDEARKIFENALRVDFRTVEELAGVYCAYAEMELRHNNGAAARRLLEQATRPPASRRVGERQPVQHRVYRSTRLWAFRADLEETLGSFASTRNVYEQMLDLKVASPRVVLNYAHYLEENKYFEESFRAYEKGIALFKFPHVFDLWISYLSKFVARYGGRKLERARELFEHVVTSCPPTDAKVFYIMYANLEEEFGLARHAMSVYDRATSAVADQDRFSVFALYVQRAAEFFGVTRTREIYEKAIEALPDVGAREMCLRFAELERLLGEIDRARAIFTHGAQFANPTTEPVYWQKWRTFEVDHGNEDTFREMLRVKRTIQAQFTSQMNFVASEVIGGTAQPKVAETDMEALERLAVQHTQQVAVNPEAIELDEEEGEDLGGPDIDVEEKGVPAELFEQNVRSEMSKKEGALARLKRKRKE